MSTTAAEIAEAWRRERPGTPVDAIEVFTPIVRLAKLLTDDRTRVLRAAGIDTATLDLLSVLRRSGPPYTLTTRELTERTLVTAGAISQRVARAEQEGLVTRAPDRSGHKAVAVSLTAAGHAVIERSVDAVLGRDSELVAGLTVEEREVVIPLLDKLEGFVRARTA
ncbi:transcriptional regulator, MarR family [Catenulispora acidiphila DSM 44928]|uniref:Transcriptional regulator, MarR family n=1 Tax=Catenulispora acidiphila (strain DSM 44928 / JCM 14897 / NBRC 102108 / NRRL B-24433 / ID139908) TaxID=479433 RepID=C7QB74_CATAD|nr:MarR family transcriptional regulator [Catenulispora acidiphila]ACU76365.1 transcriptional regulator, MarR family [Catenulispora acidiphila DSM 44928]